VRGITARISRVFHNRRVEAPGIGLALEAKMEERRALVVAIGFFFALMATYLAVV